MTVARSKGNRGLADILFSRIVRSRGRCEYPGCDSQGPFDTAHLIGRNYSAVRCVETNAICACRTHHALIDSWPEEKLRVIEATIGMDVYEQNRDLARAGHALSAALFWAAEVDRLKTRCVELGLSDRRAA